MGGISFCFSNVAFRGEGKEEHFGEVCEQWLGAAVRGTGAGPSSLWGQHVRLRLLVLSWCFVEKPWRRGPGTRKKEGTQSSVVRFIHHIERLKELAVTNGSYYMLKKEKYSRYNRRAPIPVPTLIQQTGWGKSRFTVVRMENKFTLVSLSINYCIIFRTNNYTPSLPHPICNII